MGLAEWFDKQPYGAMTKLMLDAALAGTPVSWATICRAKRRQPINDRSAQIICKLTKGAVPVEILRAGRPARVKPAARGRSRKRRKAA